LAVDEMDFENPVAHLAFLIEGSHRQMAIKMDVKRHLIVRDLLMWKLPDEIAGDWTAELPTEFVRKRYRIGRKLVCCDVGCQRASLSE
jgi:hypothetical protein